MGNLSESEFMDALPMSDEKQAAIIGHVLTNNQFFLSSYKISPSWFRNHTNSQIFGAIKDIVAITKKRPTMVELKSSQRWQREDLDNQKAIHAAIDNCLYCAGQVSIDVLRPELTNWLRSKILFDAFQKGAKGWNRGNFEESAVVLEEALKNYHESRFDDDERIRFDDPDEFFKKQLDQQKDALTFGIPCIDKSIFATATDGGLVKGTSTIILAPLNVGKTTTMLNTIKANLLKERNIFFITHEGSEENIQMKLLQSFFYASEVDLAKMNEDPIWRPKIKACFNLINKHLLWIPYCKAGMTVEEVFAMIRREHERWKIMHDGVGFDMIVDDYPAILGSNVESKGNYSPRHIIGKAYNYFFQYAKEEKLHCLLAAQTNRDGVKQNRDEENMHLLDEAAMAEAIGPAQGVNNLITVNRSPSAERGNYVILHMAKCKSGRKGLSVVCRNDLDKAIMFDSKYPHYSYYGTRNAEARANELLMNLTENGQILDIERVT